jgi:hypothetical protein
MADVVGTGGRARPRPVVLALAALLLAVSAIAAVPGVAQAQSETAQVRGVVRDLAGRSVRGVQVVLYESTNGRTKGPRVARTRTNASRGAFKFSVEPGCYRVKLTSRGPTWQATGTRTQWFGACVGAGQTTTGLRAVQNSAAVTIGTAASTDMAINEVVPEPNHGTRIYCPVSHFAHDDPIVNPGEPGGSHLHMFWGNTGADAHTTTASLLNSGRSSCEGGVNNRSAYWVPAVFNANDEVVLPSRVISYYKSFGVPDRSLIQPIPNGLQMLANRDVLLSGPWFFTIGESSHNGLRELNLTVRFPPCVAVDGAGQPILTSADNVSHLSYATAGTANACPASHPYRIAGLIYTMDFPVDPDSDWYLSSDMGAAKGSTLHGDYIAAWDASTMDDLTRCNRESRNCDFSGGRGQLPDRFLSPSGVAIYTGSLALAPGVDTTPFGDAIGPMAP